MDPIECSGTGTGTETIIEVLVLADGGPAQVTWGDRRGRGTLRIDGDRLRLDLDGVEGEGEPAALAQLELEHGRSVYHLELAVEHADAAAWSLSWPSSVQRRDRRRFERSGPEGFVLTLSSGTEAVEVRLVDVSVNGASFVVPEGRQVSVGDRLDMEVTFERTAPAQICFEVLGLRDDGPRQVARGRFLAPGHLGDGWVQLDISSAGLAELLGALPR